MRVLITIRRSPARRYLVHLFTRSLISEVKRLLDNKKYPQAITTVFTKGIFEREIHEGELPALHVDLVLTEHNARWDLVK